MPVVRLKGLNQVSRTLADGRRVTYWYAWKGGPRLEGKPGSPEFMAAYSAAVASRKATPAETLAGLVGRYKASPEFAAMADTTRRQWVRWLDRLIADAGPLDIGGLTFRALGDPDVRADLLEWRDQWAATPRTADYAIQVLSAVLSWGVERRLIRLNPAFGLGRLASANHADAIWTADEIAAYRAKAPSPEVAVIVPLACATGLRREDLRTLTWAHVSRAGIIKPTGKSRGRKLARVPMTPELRSVLAEIREQQARRLAEQTALAAKKNRPPPAAPLTVLSNTRCQPWSTDGLEHQVIKTKGLAGVTKRLHDARGTFATRLRKAGLKASKIAMIMGWEEDRIERLLTLYVDGDALLDDIAAELAENEAGRKTPN